jgi:hypothetical protein
LDESGILRREQLRSNPESSAIPLTSKGATSDLGWSGSQWNSSQYPAEFNHSAHVTDFDQLLDVKKSFETSLAVLCEISANPMRTIGCKIVLARNANLLLL